MNFSTTSGTYAYIKKIYQKNTDVFLLYNNKKTVLIHESKKFSPFNNPVKYTILASSSKIVQRGVVLLTYITKINGADDLLHDAVLNIINKQVPPDKIKAFRLLKSIVTNDYVVLTQWDSFCESKRWDKLAVLLPQFSGASFGDIFAAKNYSSRFSVPEQIR